MDGSTTASVVGALYPSVVVFVAIEVVDVPEVIDAVLCEAFDS